MGELPQGYAPSASVGTRLVTEPDDPHQFTANQETDARTGLTRGLAEYVSQLSWEAVVGGRFFQFQRVYESWPEAEDEAVYPSAVVRAESGGEYEASKMTPGVQASSRLTLPDGRYVISPSEYAINLVLEFRATDPEERQQICAMLEKELSPLDWRYGLLLELPHYFNQRGIYELEESRYVDGTEEAMQRLRAAHFVLRGRVPVTRLSSYPLAKIQPTTEVVEELGDTRGVIRGRG